MQPSKSMDTQSSFSPVRKQRKMTFNNNRQYVSIFDLPEELLAEILVRLSVKSIFRCMFVQKLWYHLIKTRMFITLHLNYQKKFPDSRRKYLLFRNNNCNSLTVRFDDVQCEEYCTLETIIPWPGYLFWHVSSYGLICVSTMFLKDRYDPNIYLWNPLVQKYKTLPESPLPRFSFNKREWLAREWQGLAFGFVPDLNDYVVVHIVKLDSNSELPDSHSDSVMIGVYSLNANSWKKRSQENVSVYGIDGYDVAFVNGAAYWVGFDLNEHKIIMCFDTKTDVLRQIALPEWVYDGFYNPTIYPFYQSIAYFVHDQSYNVHMYVLKDDPINGISWEKKMSVSSSENTKSETLGLRNNGEPIFEKLYNLIAYNNYDDREEYSFVDSWNRWTLYPFEEGPGPTFLISPFIESLVLLDVHGNN